MENEVAEITRAVFERFGYDFRGYRHRPLEGRMRYLCTKLRLAEFAELRDWILANPDRIDFVIENLTISVSDYFREPETFAEVKTRIFSLLSSFSSITIWHAGCAGGQEVFSLAVLLKEAGLYSRARIFASDISGARLNAARGGAKIPLNQFETVERRYRESGGAGLLTSHLRMSGDGFRFDPALMDNVTFVEHNLATDGVFCEANLIFCRNVLIYFGDDLQLQVFNLFQDSLARGGFLCLGSRETPIGAGPGFVKEQGCNRIYRPLRPPRGPILAMA